MLIWLLIGAAIGYFIARSTQPKPVPAPTYWQQYDDERRAFEDFRVQAQAIIDRAVAKGLEMDALMDAQEQRMEQMRQAGMELNKLLTEAIALAQNADVAKYLALQAKYERLLASLN